MSRNSWKVGQESTNRDKFLRRICSFPKMGVCLEPTFEATALITCEVCKFQSKSWPAATNPRTPQSPLMIFLLMFNTGTQVHYLLCINLSQIKLIDPWFMTLPFRCYLLGTERYWCAVAPLVDECVAPGREAARAEEQRWQAAPGKAASS